jgi:hypothetical protein
MNLTTDPREFAPSHPRYAFLAAALRACGLAFYADNEKLLDVVIEQASALLPRPEVDDKIISTECCSFCGSLRSVGAACLRCGRGEGF